MLLLENVTQSRSHVPFDKTKILGVSHVRAALTSLAHFHGVWWRFLNNVFSSSERGFTVEDVERALVEQRTTKSVARTTNAAWRSVVMHAFQSSSDLIMHSCPDSIWGHNGKKMETP